VGPLTPTPGSAVYLDANSIIYSVERIEPYASLLGSVWDAARAGTHTLLTSSLSLLETLVGPIKSGDTTLEAGYRSLLQQASDLRLVPVTEAVLERAARLRAETALKTPDAIHAASALVAGCALFITNDVIFRHVPGLNVVVLRDLPSP
jgi:predicted nucleic acid-binding protein